MEPEGRSPAQDIVRALRVSVTIDGIELEVAPFRGSWRMDGRNDGQSRKQIQDMKKSRQRWGGRRPYRVSGTFTLVR